MWEGWWRLSEQVDPCKALPGSTLPPWLEGGGGELPDPPSPTPAPAGASCEAFLILMASHLYFICYSFQR